MLSTAVALELGLHELRFCYSSHCEKQLVNIVSRHGEYRIDVPFGSPVGLDTIALPLKLYSINSGTMLLSTGLS